MARVHNGILGEVTGKAGGKVYRIMNGKSFRSERPVHYNASKSKAAVANRDKFAAATAFAKYVNSIPLLKLIWKSAKLKGTTSFNRLIKYNSKLIGDSAPSINNIIVPPEGTSSFLYFPIEAVSVSLKEAYLQIRISQKHSLFNQYKLMAVFMFHQPINKQDSKYQFCHVDLDVKMNDRINVIESVLPDSIIKTAQKYSGLILYFSLVNFKEGKPIWSPTYSTEINLIG